MGKILKMPENVYMSDADIKDSKKRLDKAISRLLDIKKFDLPYSADFKYNQDKELSKKIRKDIFILKFNIERLQKRIK